MAHEIDWNRSLKRKLHVWRGSERRPRSIKTEPACTPREYREQWSYATILPRVFRNAYYVETDEQKQTLAGFADRIEREFGEGATSTDMPDPIFDAFLLSGFDLLGMYNAGESLPKQWFRLGARYTLEVIFALPEASSIVHPDGVNSYQMTQHEAQERALITSVRRLFIAIKKEKEYEELLDLASEHFEDSSTSFETRVRLACIFPDREDWGNALIDSMERLPSEAYKYRPEQRSQHHMLLFSSGADLEHMLALAELCDPRSDNPALQYDPNYHIRVEHFSLYALLDHLEADAREPLLRLLELPWNSCPEILIDVLCNIPHQEVFDKIALAYEPQWEIQEGVRTLFLNYPEMAVQAIERRLDEKDGPLGDDMRKLYEEFDRMQKRLEAEASDEQHFAERDDLTGVLANPPWHGKGKNASGGKGKKIPKALKMLDRLEDEFTFLDAKSNETERYRQNARVAALDFSTPNSAYFKSCYDRVKAYVSGTSDVFPDAPELRHVLVELADQAIAKAPLTSFVNTRYWNLKGIQHLLAERPELYKAWLESNNDKETLLSLGQDVVWPGMAPDIADCLGTKTKRDDALEWIRKNPRAMIVGAIPAYLATRGAKKKKHLEEALRVARSCDEALYDEIVDAYGEEVRDVMPDFDDATTAYPVKMPKLPSFWNPAAYPPILLEKDLSKRLPVDICDDIALMLKFSPPGKPYIGLQQLREQADATSLGEFTWALFQSWIKADCPLDEEWVIQGLALFGGPQMVRELPYQIDAWARTNYYKRSEKILEAIEADANEYTIEALWRCYHGGHDRTNRSTAHARLIGITGAKTGDFTAELDRKTPTFGIGLDHTIKLTDGEGVKVWLDEDLEPHLVGTNASSLDEPTQLRWERLGKLCAWQARFQSRRFERALRKQRAWTTEAFRDDILGHPLLGMLAHKFVWGIFEDEKLVETFRIDESNEPIDVEDEPVDIASQKNRTIRLVHPLHLQEEELAKWVQTFADYEIIQPFEQLSRACWLAKEAKALLEGELARFGTTTGALQVMYEDHDWSGAHNRKRTYPEPYFSRQIVGINGSYSGSMSITAKLSRNSTSSWSSFSPGATPSDTEECMVTLKFARKVKDYEQFDKVALSELVWELSRARDMAK